MELIELIAFLVTMLLLFLVTARQKRLKFPEQGEGPLFEEELEILPRQPARQREKRGSSVERNPSLASERFKSSLDGYRQKSLIEGRRLESSITEERFLHMDEEVASRKFFQEEGASAYEIGEERELSAAARFALSLPELNSLLLGREVISPPRALDPYEPSF